MEWLKFIGSKGMIHRSSGKQLDFTSSQLSFLDSLYSNFELADAEKIKNIEQTTNHDVKAVEYYIKERITGFSDKVLEEVKEYVHFCCTSEDINNLAYSLMLTDGKLKALIPTQEKLLGKLGDMAETYSSITILSRTHGQSASPTTLGKEIANFVYRLSRQTNSLKEHKFSGKINGAVGNFNAHYFVYPEYNWSSFSKEFIENRLLLRFNPYTTQIEPHDTIAEFYSNLNIFNTILIGLSQDFWHYISLGYFIQKTIEGEVGSSTMPHKVNPIDFENAEGNLGLATTLADFFMRKLPISRFQRDLSDSTVMRNHGSMLGHSLLAYQSLMKGLNKMEVNQDKIKSELDEHWEVLAEPIQMMLRKLNVEGAYEQLKKMTRGKKIGKEDISKLIEGLQIDEKEKEKLRNLTPENYMGNAGDMAKNIKKYAKL